MGSCERWRRLQIYTKHMAHDTLSPSNPGRWLDTIRKAGRQVLCVTLLLATLPPQVAISEESLEYQLAVIHAKGRVPEDHITVKRFAALLRQLDATFPEDKKQIADSSVWAITRFEEDGIEQSLIGLMEGMNRLFDRPIENQSYKDYLASYVLIRLKGMSHVECIDGLKGLIEGLGIDQLR